MTNKILLTGASGFIGFHLCKSLLEDGIDVLGIDNMNDYYDVSLKESRLNQLNDFSSSGNFQFNRQDITNQNKFPTLCNRHHHRLPIPCCAMRTYQEISSTDIAATP